MMISIITIQSTQEDVCNGSLRQLSLSLILDEIRSFLCLKISIDVSTERLISKRQNFPKEKE